VHSAFPDRTHVAQGAFRSQRTLRARHCSHARAGRRLFRCRGCCIEAVAESVIICISESDANLDRTLEKPTCRGSRTCNETCTRNYDRSIAASGRASRYQEGAWIGMRRW